MDENCAPNTFVKFTNNSQYLLSSSLDQVIKIWEINFNEKPVKIYKGHDNKHHIDSVDYCLGADDKKLICSGSEDGSIFFWDLQSMKVEYSFMAHKGKF